MIFTTSWDDGYKYDLRVAELLDKYRLTGTFYICPKQQNNELMLTKNEILSLSSKHEIGAHSIHHPHLAKISLKDAKSEITQSKQWIESIIGKQCKMFCYPHGSTNQEVQSLVQKAGFLGARTTTDYKNFFNNNFAIPTTLQISKYPLRNNFKKISHFLDPLYPARKAIKNNLRDKLPYKSYFSWLNLSKQLYLQSQKSDCHFFHLWGHSDEIERWKMWDELEDFFAFAASFDNVISKPNFALIHKNIE